VLKPVRERKALVLFTDGVDTRSGKATRSETLDLARESPSTIYCVYYNTEYDPPAGTQPSLTGIPFPPIILNPYPPSSAGNDAAAYQAGRAYLDGLADFSGGLVLDGMGNLDLPLRKLPGTGQPIQSRLLFQQFKTGRKFRKVQVKLNRPGSQPNQEGYYAKKDKKG
jgi:hypothetical protein